MKVKAFLDLLPATIKIGPHDWHIVVTDKMEAEADGHKNYGETNTYTLTLRLNPTIIATCSMAISVFLHELYHAGLFSLGAKQPKQEEPQALLNETLYSMIFKDNIWLLDWMKKGYK